MRKEILTTIPILIAIVFALVIQCNADKDIMRNSEQCRKEKRRFQRCFLINFSTCYIGQEMLKKSDDPTQSEPGRGVDRCTFFVWMGFSVGTAERCKLYTLSPECRNSGY